MKPQLTMLTLCDRAYCVNNRLDVIGTFDYWQTSELPCLMNCSLAGKIMLPEKLDEVTIQVIMRDSNLEVCSILKLKLTLGDTPTGIFVIPFCFKVSYRLTDILHHLEFAILETETELGSIPVPTVII
jgi:hypothetical protein